MNVDTFQSDVDIGPVRSLPELRRLLARLDGATADDLEDDPFEPKQWESSASFKDT
jgi:hypothetical protein